MAQLVELWVGCGALEEYISVLSRLAIAHRAVRQTSAPIVFACESPVSARARARDR